MLHVVHNMNGCRSAMDGAISYWFLRLLELLLIRSFSKGLRYFQGTEIERFLKIHFCYWNLDFSGGYSPGLLIWSHGGACKGVRRYQVTFYLLSGVWAKYIWNSLSIELWRFILVAILSSAYFIGTSKFSIECSKKTKPKLFCNLF